MHNEGGTAGLAAEINIGWSECLQGGIHRSTRDSVMKGLIWWRRLGPINPGNTAKSVATSAIRRSTVE